jgi:hypothetical protein
MANYEPDRPGIAGAQPVSHAAAASDSFSNNGKVMVRVNNGGGAPITLTVDDPNSSLPAATAFNPDAAIVVTNAQARIIGPFPPARFNDANGRVQLAWSGTTSVTWEAHATE